MYGCPTESLPTHSIVSLARIKKTKYARQDTANKTKIKFLRGGLTWAVALPITGRVRVLMLVDIKDI